jgi:Type IV secretion system pilin
MIMHALAASISVSPAIPGITNVSQTSPGGWIAGIYKFALIVSGILAFGAIVYGGFMYATSAGNASRQAEGRSWIWSALIGLLLLAGAYIILQTINPNLTNLQIAPLSSVNTQQTTGQ